MDKFRYHREGEDKCRQGIGWKKDCRRCSYEMLCLFQQNQEKRCLDTHEAKRTTEKK